MICPPVAAVKPVLQNYLTKKKCKLHHHQHKSWFGNQLIFWFGICIWKPERINAHSTFSLLKLVFLLLQQCQDVGSQTGEWSINRSWDILITLNGNHKIQIITTSKANLLLVLWTVMLTICKYYMSWISGLSTGSSIYCSLNMPRYIYI